VHGVEFKEEAFTWGPERAACQVAMVEELEIGEARVARLRPGIGCSGGRAEAMTATTQQVDQLK
jgi:hypothetical protein